jgi:aspartate/methionine/tyrosine aminotransferase
MFSSRVQADLAPNRLAHALERRRAEGRPCIDLTESNPTRAGFDYPADLLAPLGDRRGLTYSPQPFGVPEARRAVAEDYARRGLTVGPEHIVLTVSSSDAYSLLFRVLCDPGDQVLAPRPSYPLFEHLGRLDAVTILPYDLEYHGAWSIDVGSVESALSERTHALLLVTPNNPTGSYVKSHELDRLAAICAERDVAIIADEVFADYELVPGAAQSSGRVLPRQDVLTFSLGGLSKSIGLPQVKLGWIGIGGPAAAVEQAVARLEFACDTYLSVSTPVQLAAPELLDRGASLRRQIQARVRANYNYLAAAGAALPTCEVLNAEGGWYAIVRVPSLCPEEELVLNLLAAADLLTHPGYFFDFAHESHLVVSLLVSETLFREGVSRMFRYLQSRGGPA